MEILPGFERDTDDLLIATEESAGHVRSDRNAMANPAEKRIVPGVVRHPQRNLALRRRSLFDQNLARRPRVHIKQLYLFQPVSETRRRKRCDLLPHFEGEPVIALRVDTAV